MRHFLWPANVSIAIDAGTLILTHREAQLMMSVEDSSLRNQIQESQILDLRI